MPCVPKSLIKAADCDMPQDGLLLWLEEHIRRLQNGMIKTRALKTSRYICLYPEAPPLCTSATTNGVKVRASAVLVPEHPHGEGHVGTYLYSYSIRLSVPEACMLGGVYYPSCQLHSATGSFDVETGLFPMCTVKVLLGSILYSYQARKSLCTRVARL